jgi:hypothetical protein
MDKHKKKVAAAMARLESMKLSKAFDPFQADSRPTKQQDDIFRAINDVQFRYVRAGNRSGKCLISQTLVATPRGPVAIEHLKVGDIVYDENGKEIKVKAVKYQGRQKVLPITRAKKQIAVATRDHRWLTESGDVVNTEELPGEVIKRTVVKSKLGPINEPHAYALGAFLGDGCGLQKGVDFQISSESDEIPKKVASCLEGAKVVKLSGDNYTYSIRSNYNIGTQLAKLYCRHYLAWCTHAAHNKVADIDVIKTWNRESVLNFVAGLVDTDGSIYVLKNGRIQITFGMQAKSVVEAFKWCMLALFQYDSPINVDIRDKYKNGPVYELKYTDHKENQRILKELGPKLINRKNIKSDKICRPNRFNMCVSWPREKEADTWDIEVDSPTHLFLLANGYVSHNSALAARELTWILQDEHPYWKRPEKWGTAPLTCLVVGKSRQGIESELWSNKIRPFLNDRWKETRAGSVLQSVENTVTRDKIIFLTHADSSERIIDNLQGFTAHYVWVDEMPRKLRVLEELQNRVATTDGPFIATFTPKVVNLEVKKFVDVATPPVGKRYPLHRLENPVFSESRDIEMQKLEGMPTALKKAILEGEWMTGSDAVFDVDIDKMIQDLPETYDRGWRHVESIDPGITSGYTLWAEDPSTNIWYCIISKYLEEIRDPTKIFHTVQNINNGYNIIRRICDPAASMYLGYASSQKVAYTFPYAKNQGRKNELLQGLQVALNEGKVKLTPAASILIDELSNVIWNEQKTKIVNSHKYHTMDSAAYFVDCMPTPNTSQLTMTPHQFIYEENERRKQIKRKKELQMLSRRRRW